MSKKTLNLIGTGTLIALISSIVSAFLGLILKIEILGVLFSTFLLFSFILSFIYRSILWKYKYRDNVPSYINLSIVIGLFYLLAFVLVISTNRRRTMMEKAYSIRYNLRLIGNTIVKYAEYNNGHLPDANQWCDILMSYDKTLTRQNFKHPLIKEWDCNIAFNKNLSGLKLSEISKDAVLLFEADGGWNLSGDVDLFQKKYKEMGGYVISLVFLADEQIKEYRFAEGGYRYFDSNSTESFKPLRWKP
jgi:hypothetical protein